MSLIEQSNKRVKVMSRMIKSDYKDKICLLGLGVLDKNIGYPIKFEFQANSKGNIRDMLTLNNYLLFI